MRATVSTVYVLLIAYNFTMGTGSDQVNSPLAMHQLVGGLHVNKGLLNRPAPGLCDARLYKDLREGHFVARTGEDLIQSRFHKLR